MMIEMDQVYKCEICGNEVKIVHVGGGQLVCCNQPMVLKEESQQEE